MYRYLLFLALLPAVSCGPAQRVAATLDDVETYINARPDSALAVLQAMDTTTLRTRAMRARYSLLHVMALDKCYKDITVPGLLDEATGWFERHGTADEKMKSLFYQGRIAQDNGDRNRAAVFYARAEEYAGKVEDQHTLGVLYLSEASVFSAVYNIEKEREYIEKGLSAFQMDEDPMQEMALGQLAISYFASREWARADSLFTKGITASESNPYAMSVFLSNYARMKLLQPKPAPEDALKLLDRMRIEYGYPLSMQDAGAYAYALILSGRKTEATEVLKQLTPQASSASQEVEIWIGRCAMASGEYKQAYESLNRAHLSEESAIQDVLTDSVTDAISTYHEVAAKQARMQYRINIAIMFIILLTLCLALALAHIRKNKLEADKSRMLEAYAVLEKEASEHESRTSELQVQLHNFREVARQERVLRFRQTGRLQAAIWHLNRTGESWIKKDSRLVTLKEELCQIYDIDDTGEKLVRRLDRDLDGKIIPLVEKLQFKGKPDEQLFLCCCLLDLPAEMVAARFGWTSNHVRVKKHRLKDQIAKLNNADYDALFDIRRKGVTDSCSG